MATIKDVAKLAGVSKSTVSLAFNQPLRVNPETIARIRDAARQVGYSADPIAQSLKSGRSRLIGMVLADVNNPFFGELLNAVEYMAFTNDYLVIVADSGADWERERDIVRHMTAQRVAGLLISPCGASEAQCAHIGELDMPFVLFDQKVPGVTASFVGTDNALASAMLTRHLIELGHRHIAMLGGTENTFTSEGRRQGFVDTAHAHGLTDEEIQLLPTGFNDKRAYEDTVRLLTGPRRPTAILAASNVMALGALQAINDLEIPCPERISLAAIDDIPWSRLIKPKITCVVQPVHDMGRDAVDLLFEEMSDNASAEPAERIRMPHFVPGGSTSAPGRARDP